MSHCTAHCAHISLTTFLDFSHAFHYQYNDALNYPDNDWTEPLREVFFSDTVPPVGAPREDPEDAGGTMSLGWRLWIPPEELDEAAGERLFYFERRNLIWDFDLGWLDSPVCHSARNTEAPPFHTGKATGSWRNVVIDRIQERLVPPRKCPFKFCPPSLLFINLWRTWLS